jgi:hypothetical protein
VDAKLQTLFKNAAKMSCKNKKIPSGLADSPLSGLDIVIMDYNF